VALAGVAFGSRFFRRGSRCFQVALKGAALESRFFGRGSRVILGGPEQKSRPEVNSSGAVVGNSRWLWSSSGS
jgi:hypothetical protein